MQNLDGMSNPVFWEKTGFDISCKLSPVKIMCMECQILLSGKKKKNIFSLSSAEFAQRVVMVKAVITATYEIPEFLFFLLLLFFLKEIGLAISCQSSFMSSLIFSEK